MSILSKFNILKSTPRNRIIGGMAALGTAGVAYGLFGRSGSPVEAQGPSAEEIGTQRAMMEVMQQAGPMTMMDAGSVQYDGRQMAAPNLGASMG